MKYLWAVSATVFLSACGGSDNTDSEAKTVSFDESTCIGISPSNNIELTGTCGASVDATWQSTIDDNVKIATFVQDVEGTSINRRYLTYLPSGFDAEQAYPLVIMLHGANVNAEITREFDTGKTLETLADEHQFIVVYGNAAASVDAQQGDDIFFANQGVWVFGRIAQELGIDLNQLTNDDLARLASFEFDYLEQIERDLEERGVIIDNDARFISGISNGGQMAMAAAEFLAQPYSAAFAGVPPPYFASSDITTSMMIYYSENDPLITSNPAWADYSDQMDQVIETWVDALGVDEGTFNNTPYEPIADVVVEGQDYIGSAAFALNTEDSTLEQKTVFSMDGSVQLKIMRSERAGHAIPHPLQMDNDTVENFTGFRNEDLNSMEEMWRFFSEFID